MDHNAHQRTRRVLLALIILAALVAVGYFIYASFFAPRVGRPGTLSKEELLSEIAKQSPSVPQSVSKPLLDQIVKDSTPSKTTPGLSADQKAALLGDIAAQSSKQ